MKILLYSFYTLSGQVSRTIAALSGKSTLRSINLRYIVNSSIPLRACSLVGRCVSSSVIRAECVSTIFVTAFCLNPECGGVYNEIILDVWLVCERSRAFGRSKHWSPQAYPCFSTSRSPDDGELGGLESRTLTTTLNLMLLCRKSRAF